jgi:hypothetical protein
MLETEEQLRGIGGWLILLAINIVLLPMSLVSHVAQAAQLFTKPAILARITPGSSLYDAHWQALHVVESGGYGILILPTVALIALFFFRHRFFPVVCSAIMLCLVGLASTGVYLVFTIPTTTAFYRSTVTTSSVVRVVGCGLWIAYLWRSRRVRLTFVRECYPSPFFPFFTVA